MGYVWMVVPVLPILIVIGLAATAAGMIFSALSQFNIQQPQSVAPVAGEILALYGLAFVSFFMILIIGAFAFYYMIERRNAHFRRQQQFFLNLQRYLTSKMGTRPSENAFRLEQLSEESIFEERGRPSGLWSVLYIFVTPIVGLIVAFNITQDLRRHEELQSKYQAILLSTLTEVNLGQPTLPTSRLHKRDPILFLILTAITGGLFWIYWFYTLLKDYNEHFQDQAQFEDQILTLLRPPSQPRKCTTCGGEVPGTAKFCPNCGNRQAT
jgi:positive regulator of sigma E activity